jgi:hypothetical protein
MMRPIHTSTCLFCNLLREMLEPVVIDVNSRIVSNDPIGFARRMVVTEINIVVHYDGSDLLVTVTDVYLADLFATSRLIATDVDIMPVRLLGTQTPDPTPLPTVIIVDDLITFV